MAHALHERAQRIYERYGNVMLEVKGMTKAGIDRKATCRALFSKLLYLQGGPAQVPGSACTCKPPPFHPRLLCLMQHGWPQPSCVRLPERPGQ